MSQSSNTSAASDLHGSYFYWSAAKIPNLLKEDQDAVPKFKIPTPSSNQSGGGSSSTKQNTQPRNCKILLGLQSQNHKKNSIFEAIILTP